ncbi:hypothetical protein [Sphingomonas sp. Mn802worker]|uniref:hypothetical protein n=1 Tax=Sphingomonas sp. Mn802worker TaxID=629773 RepID=UPI00036E7E80|nr:hypothetical protein [Sphingomonas sp. Mn802worker]
MIATLATLALFALLGFGAYGVLAGTVVAVIASPSDRPFQLTTRAVGLIVAAVGLVIFVQASLLIAGQIA